MPVNNRLNVPENGNWALVGIDPAADEGSVLEKVSQLDLSNDQYSEGGNTAIGHIGDVGARGLAFADQALEGFRLRQALEHGHSIDMANKLSAAADASARQSADIWGTQHRLLFAIDFNAPAGVVDNYLANVGQAVDRAVATNHEEFIRTIDGIDRDNVTRHQISIKRSEAFDLEFKGFHSICLNLLEIERIGLSVIANHCKEMRASQLILVKEAVASLIEDRQDRRIGVQQQCDINMANAQQQHNQDFENKKQAHVENKDRASLEAHAEKQRRTDDLAEKRVDLEKHVANLRHELEMDKQKAKSPGFWDRLFQPFWMWI